MVLRDHPDWTNKRIAEAVGCNPDYLSQLETFKQLRKQLRTHFKARRPGGFRTRPGEVDASVRDDDEED